MMKKELEAIHKIFPDLGRSLEWVQIAAKIKAEGGGMLTVGLLSALDSSREL